MLHPTTHAAIVAHVEADYPREACGLIVSRETGKEMYVPCRNLAEKQGEQFMLPAEDWAAAEDMGAVQMVVHSHPDAGPEPSDADRVTMEASGLPWLIVSVREGKAEGHTLNQPTGWKAPLLGRPFYHGVLDCYTLVQDLYARHFGITLPTPVRPDNWWNNGGNLYLENYASAGFRKLREGEQIAHGDVVLMAVQSPVPNHAGVFLGDKLPAELSGLHRVPDAMLHHLYGRASDRAVYGGYWAEVTQAIIRHKELEHAN